MSRPQHGFTLLELIIVIGIFGVFSLMAYGGLNTVLSARAGIERNLLRTEEFDRAYLRLRTDFQNAAPRPIRDGNGATQPSFGYDSYTQRVEFTRAGWPNLLTLPRATLERVSYGVEDSGDADRKRAARGTDRRLVRRSWTVLDRAAQTQPVEVTVLDHIESLDWRFLDATGQRSDTWPSSSAPPLQPGADGPPPTAIELRLRTRDWGELRMLFRVGAEGAARLAELSKPPPPPAPTRGAPDAPATPNGGQPPPDAVENPAQ